MKNHTPASPAFASSSSISYSLHLLPEHLREFLAGTLSGAAQVVVGHPFDTVKVRLQTQSPGISYNGAIDCLRQTVRSEGIAGLFKGINSPLMGVGLCNAVLFSANENFRRLLQNGDPNKTLSINEMAVAGGLSGVVIAVVLCPIELVKIRLQVQRSPALGPNLYSGVFDCATRIHRKRGVAGLYRGFGMTLLREIPSFAAYFGGYEIIKEVLAQRHPDNNQHPRTLDLLLAGGLAGQIAWLTCYPQDVIKTRIQESQRLGSTREAVRELWKEGRFRGFWRGFTTTLVRAFPANAATFLVYEKCIEWMGC